MKTELQDALKAMESKVRNSLNRLSGVQVRFERIQKNGGYYAAVYTVFVPIMYEEDHTSEIFYTESVRRHERGKEA